MKSDLKKKKHGHGQTAVTFRVTEGGVKPGSTVSNVVLAAQK